jgi:hypothetical protein
LTPRFGYDEHGCDEADASEDNPVDTVDAENLLARAVSTERLQSLSLFARVSHGNRLRGTDPRKQSADEEQPHAEREDEFCPAERLRSE